MKKIIIAIIIIIVVAVAIFVLRNSAAPKEEVIKIGGAFALSGVGSEWGIDEMNATQLAVEEINSDGGIKGRKIKLVVEDSPGDKVAFAATVARKLIDVDNVLAIIGPTWDETAQVFAPIFEQSKIPIIAPDATRGIETERKFDYFLSTYFPQEVEIQRIVKYVVDRDLKNVIVMRVFRGGFYEFVNNRFVEDAKGAGLNIVDDLTIGTEFAPTDFRTVITLAKAKNPQAVFLPLDEKSICLFLKQSEELGFNKPILSTAVSLSSGAIKNCAELMERFYYAFPKQEDGYAKFVESFRAKYDREPNSPAASNAYDAVYILKEALKRSNLQGGEVLQKALLQTKNFRGASLNSMSFDEQGFIVAPVAAYNIKTVRNGQSVVEE